MSKFDDLLEKYAQLSVEINDIGEYLKGMTEERETVGRELKALSREQPEQPKEDGGFLRELRGALDETAKIVAAMGDGVTAAQLAEHLSITQDAARLRLQRAEKRGLIRRVAFGRYSAKPQIPSQQVSLQSLPQVAVEPKEMHETNSLLEHVMSTTS